MSEEEVQEHGITAARDLDIDSLKALSHPLRVQLFDTLSVYGPATASGLAERLGESSGATSYHLRQLEKHGFVRELEGRGTTRERWWERVPGAINIGSRESDETPAGRSAAQLIYREFRRSQDRMLNDFVDRGHEELPREWAEASDLATVNSNMTAQQLQLFVGAVRKAIDEHVMPYKGQTGPGVRAVHIEFNAFPVVDAAAQPTGDTP
jgi:DNA-binding transcriptional ArsR family regulator